MNNAQSRRGRPSPRRRRFLGISPEVQDAILLFVGLAGIIYETLVAPIDRPYLLGIFAWMIGLPYLGKLDRVLRPPRNTEEGDDEKEE